MRNLDLDHLQLDEIWTFVRKKQAHLTDQRADERRDRRPVSASSRWTKRRSSSRRYVVGKRTKENTEAFLLDLAKRVVCPDPALTAVEDKPLVSTDGWPAYPQAVDLAFADTVAHGVLIKNYADIGATGPVCAARSDRG